MNILQTIAAHKKTEVEINKHNFPLSALEALPLFNRRGHSLRKNLENSEDGIITEFKKRSPSKEHLNLQADVEQISAAYEKAGASGISVLTDETFFGGSNEDLLSAREKVSLPLLRKDFLVDEYQIFEAKAIGADVILLIAAILTPKEISLFAKRAKYLGLEVLLEVHNEAELLQNLIPEVDMVGVNNRNLKTFEVDLNISKSLAGKIPEGFLKISESGISQPASIVELKSFGYQGFLMGENFMKTTDPGRAASEFIKSVKAC